MGNTVTTYVRDAQGNVLAVYQQAGSRALQKIESHIYGSSRLGIAGKETTAAVEKPLTGGYQPARLITFTRGEKAYELTNHLGNVLVTISDKRLAAVSNGTITAYNADVVSASDYYPFGMQMPGRTLTAANYRYGFNGKENDNEVKGDGNQQDYGERVYDPRTGRFYSVDPFTTKYPELTPYQFASNRPIDGIDLDGLEFFKKDNTNYFIDYKPVIDAKGVSTKVNNSAHNALAFTWNITLGSVSTVGKNINNYFAGGYKDAPSGNAVDNFNNTTHDIIQYHSTTPVKQQLKDLGNAATDLKNYEGAAQILLLGKFKIAESPLVEVSTSDETFGLGLQNGSGSVSGVIELNASIKSNKAFLNGVSINSKDFVYDASTGKFAMAGKNAEELRHYGLRKVIGSSENDVVGGRIKLGANGEIMTSQWSGTYGGNWTKNIADKFQSFMKKMTGKDIDHSSKKEFSDGTK